MKNITNILSEEHQNILKVIELMLSECDSLEKGKELDRNFFEKAIKFIRNYADTFHHAKEDNILYPMAEEAVSEEDKERVLQLYDEVGAGQNTHAGLLQYFGLS